VDVLVGRQYGSEGKGNIAGHIAPEYDLLLGVGAGGHVEAHDGRVAWIEIFHNGRSAKSRMLARADERMSADDRCWQ
jgi:adenylosuccinate synthase